MLLNFLPLNDIGAIMILPYEYYSFDISLIDFLIVFSVELFFFWFINNKFNFKDNIATILMISLLKIGLLSLFISWFPISFAYSIKTVTIFTVLFLLTGCILGTLMFRKELLLSKNESFNLAFQLSVLSSFVFFMIKVMFIPESYSYLQILSSSYGTKRFADSNIMEFVFSNSGSNALLFLLLGIGIFLFYNRSKTFNQTIKN